MPKLITIPRTLRADQATLFAHFFFGPRWVCARVKMTDGYMVGEDCGDLYYGESWDEVFRMVAKELKLDQYKLMRDLRRMYKILAQ